MADSDWPSVGPSPDELDAVFSVYEVREDGDRLLYYGEPLVGQDRLVEELWPRFREAGYEMRLTSQVGEHVLVAEPNEVGVDGVPWTNLVLAILTVLSTLWAGSMWYHARPFADPASILQGWPFMLGIMTVLGVHEFGHYIASRYHGVRASLPYFIPIPISFIGTFGAVIKMKGRMPDRRALFDIGVSGPLAGLVATVVVTTVGLYLDPVAVPERVMNSDSAVQVEFGYPLLLQGLSALTGQPLEYPAGQAVNPVVIAGWVGMFVTFLNLIPVGQFDGGHLLRSLLGEAHERVTPFVPVALFGLAGYLYFFDDVAGNAVVIWVFWGIFASVFSMAGSATPVSDDDLDGRRRAVGVLTILLGILCFHPVPIEVLQ
jgi:membrane-associated protease RseP (regulator of RpoE activity)